MRRQDALTRLRRMESLLRRRGVSALYLFGSTARDEAGEQSDIDILFEAEPEARFSLFDQAGLTDELEGALGARVDFIHRRNLRPALAPRVVTDLVQVF